LKVIGRMGIRGIYDKNYLEKYGGILGHRGKKRMRWEYGRRYMLLGGKRILDAGCGAGEFLKACPKGFEGVGIDVNKGAVEYLRPKGFEVYHSSATELPFEDNSFDGIHCNTVIEHLRIEEVIKMFKEFHRVLKPGGRIIIVTDHHKLVWDCAYHFRPYTIGSIKDLFKFHGYKFLKSEHLGLFRGLGLIPQPFYYLVQRLIGRLFVHRIFVLGEKE